MKKTTNKLTSIIILLLSCQVSQGLPLTLFKRYSKAQAPAVSMLLQLFRADAAAVPVYLLLFYDDFCINERHFHPR